MATMFGDITGPSAAPPLIKYSSPCREDQRLSTESKIFSNYCNISKTLGGVHPPPSFHGGGMNLHVRPRINYILDKCKLPQQWKFNEVSPVFKEDCCLTKSNYRKITILPFLSKVFGTLLRSRYPPLFWKYFFTNVLGYREKVRNGYCSTQPRRIVEKGTGPT